MRSAANASRSHRSSLLTSPASMLNSRHRRNGSRLLSWRQTRRSLTSAESGRSVPRSSSATPATSPGSRLEATTRPTTRPPLRIVSAAVLAVIAVVGLRRVGRTRESVEFSFPDRRELAGTYARFVALTTINPKTIVYFAAVIVGLGVADDLSAAGGVLFAVGAFLASLSWQELLAGVGAVAGDRLSARAQTAAIVTGNLVILVFAIVILLR